MQYLNATAKRYVQRQLFSQIKKAKTILGLAGTHPEKYIEVLPPHNQVVLVDFNPVNETIRRNSLIGEFELLKIEESNATTVNVVDCDFCRSIINNGDDLLYIYHRMKRCNKQNQFISYTFSLRGVGLQQTLNWLMSNIPEIRNNLREFESVDKYFGYRKFVKHLPFSNIYMYRDSGDIMISGLIKL